MIVQAYAKLIEKQGNVGFRGTASELLIKFYL